MSIFKDWREDTEGYRFTYRVKELFNFRQWRRLHKWRKQRMDRGWSDRDTWGAGEHIAKITAEMLQHLNDNTYVDWPEWFKLNVKEQGKDAYKNIPSVVNDITAYLDHQLTSWGDGLECKPDYKKSDDDSVSLNQKWYNEKTGKKLSEQQITSRIKKWVEEDNNLYKKATKAMQFFSRHFAGFWD